MPAKRNAAVLVAEQLIAKLREIKQSGDYPSSIHELAREAGVEEDETLLKKVVAAKKPFGEQAVALQAKNLESPVVLRGDEGILLGHDRTLSFLVENAVTPEKPLVESAKLRSRVPATLRAIWDEKLREWLARSTLPDGLAHVQQGRKSFLHLTRYPLPQLPEEVLAQRWLDQLGRSREDGAYPITWGELQRRVETSSPAVVKKALALPRFKNAVLFGMKAQAGAPIAFEEDAERLAISDLLLLEAIRQARTGTHHAINMADLKKKVTRPVQSSFAHSLVRRWEDAVLPPGVGGILQKKAPVFFLLEDLVRGTGLNGHSEAKQRPVTQEAAGDAFDAAFQEADRERGGHNFVSLVDLRRRLAMESSDFNRLLHEVRSAGKYTLSAAEGRHGLTAEELDAGIREDGSYLLYVSKRR